VDSLSSPVINVARLPISFITVTVTATTTIIIIIIIIIIVHYTTGASHKALYHRDSAFVFQRLSVLIQRYNAVAVLGTFAHDLLNKIIATINVVCCRTEDC